MIICGKEIDILRGDSIQNKSVKYSLIVFTILIGAANIYFWIYLDYPLTQILSPIAFSILVGLLMLTIIVDKKFQIAKIESDKYSKQLKESELQRIAERTEANLKLSEKIMEKKQAESQLKELNETLEERVCKRTEELNNARMAALNMMEDASIAKIKAEEANIKLTKEIAEREKAQKELENLNRQLKENQIQLVHSEKMASLGQLAAGMAHEINNPMAYITSNIGTLTEYTQSLKKMISLSDQLIQKMTENSSNLTYSKIQKYINEIEMFKQTSDLQFIYQDVDELLSESTDGTHRVNEIVKSLKCFARIDKDQAKKVNINEGIEATLKVVWNELKYKCDVEKKLGELPEIYCYPGQLNQVFMNLLVNAAHSIPKRGKVSIETFQSNGHIVVKIVDTGKGISKDNLTKIFDPFFTTKPEGQGTGLGLSITHGIIQKHNGTIDVDSKVGKGTTFTIRIPVDGVHSQEKT